MSQSVWRSRKPIEAGGHCTNSTDIALHVSLTRGGWSKSPMTRFRVVVVVVVGFSLYLRFFLGGKWVFRCLLARVCVHVSRYYYVCFVLNR